MPFDPQEQRRIMGHFATGVSVVTTCRGDELYGMTATALASLSLEPPLVLVSIDRRAQILEPMSESRVFALNFLNSDQEALSRRFAKSGQKDFSDLRLAPGETGSPIFADALAYVDCRVSEILPGGDHLIFVGEIVGGDAHSGQPLLYYCGKYYRLPE